MHLLFLDESSTPPKPERCAGRYFTIGGLIIPEGAWHAVAREFSAAKRRYGVFDEIKWRYFGQENNDKRSSIKHLDRGRKDNLRQDLFKVITSRKALTIIAATTAAESAYAMPSVQTQDDVYHLTYKSVTERFQYYLQDTSRYLGSPQYGMVISDHRMNLDDEKLRSHHHSLLEGPGMFSSNYKNIIETIHFSPSHFSPGLQLADLVAGSVQRVFQSNDSTFYELLKSSFRKSETGKIDGFGIVRVPTHTFIEPPGRGG